MSSGLKLSLALLAAFPACSSEHLAGPVSSSSERVSALTASGAGATPGAEGCPLDSPTGRVRHVIYLQVDGDRVVRDGPDGAPDLEPTPHLVDFVRSRGTLVDYSRGDNDRWAPNPTAQGSSGDPRAPLASRASTRMSSDFSTSLTGLYPSSQGRAAAGAYGSRSAPAPWVPFARAGCNVGIVSLGKMELAGAATDLTPKLAGAATDLTTKLAGAATDLTPKLAGAPTDLTTKLAGAATDVTTRVGPSSPEAAPGVSSLAWPLADLEGIAIHCAAESSMCSQSRGGAPDLLPDEPGGYTGFRALFGRELAAAIIGPSGPPVDLDGQVITEAASDAPLRGREGHVGVLASGSLTASQSLGYVAAMQERGVAVTFAHVPDSPDDAAASAEQAESGARGAASAGQAVSGARGAASAGQAESGARAAAVDRAWGAFVARLASAGITPSNALFVITVDSGLQGRWLGLVGPGVRHEAATGAIAADCADTRPTMLLLAGVQDDYSHDGRALVEAMDEEAIPSAVQVDDGVAFGLVASMYERISAPAGELELAMHEASEAARADDATYARTHAALATLTEKRDALAAEMIQKLEGAEFHARRVDANAAAALVARGAELLVEVHSLTR